MSRNFKLLKKKAINLRKQGKSYNKIQKEINVSKSTLSYWLKTIPLSEKYKKKFYNKKIQNLSYGPQSQKERRKREIKKIIEESKKEIKKPLSNQTFLLFGTALYWGEGNKKGPMEITNSDPNMIFFMVKWIEKIFKIKPKNLKARLNIYKQQNEKEIIKFWSEITKIPIENFNKTFIKPNNKNYKKNNLYYGTIKIYVPKSTNLKHKIFGWIESTLQDTDSSVELTKERWRKLENIKRPPINL
jgi:hypothetical protein